MIILLYVKSTGLFRTFLLGNMIDMENNLVLIIDNNKGNNKNKWMKK